jgi:ABC-type proline/glycine betaine transport system permease subunit
MEGKVAGPAIGLIVVGALGALMNLWGIVAGGIDPAMIAEMDLPQEQREMMEKFATTVQGAGSAFNIIGLGLDIFIIWAGVRMMKLHSWTAAVVASALMMVPCFTGCCCLVGVPLGIWSLIVLFNKDVKQAFEAKAAA